MEEQLQDVQNFVYDLGREASGRCWVPHITIAASHLYHISNDHCHSLACIKDAINKAAEALMYQTSEM